MKSLPALPRPSGHTVGRALWIAIWNIALPSYAVYWLLVQLSTVFAEPLIIRLAWFLIPAIAWHQIMRVAYQRFNARGPINMLANTAGAFMAVFGVLMVLVVTTATQPLDYTKLIDDTVFSLQLAGVFTAFTLFLQPAIGPLPSNPISGDDLRALKRVVTTGINRRLRKERPSAPGKITGGHSELQAG